jgi:LysR family hydrogen peroxide-inducible transcriptional activator
MENLPSVRHLRHLAALADHAHFGHAADACLVTQSTLSASIKELEALLGSGLVDRTKRNVVLTPLGVEVAERARKIIGEVEELAHLARAANAPLSGMLRLGAIPTVGPFLLPKVLPELRRAYVSLKLYLVEDLTARLVDSLHQGKLDVVLLALPYDCGAVDTVDLFKDPFHVGLPALHPLANQVGIKSQSLASETLLLLKDGHCLREHALAACQFNGRRSEEFEGTSLPTLVQMVDNGMGITLLPELAIEGGVLRGTSLVTRPLLSDDPARSIGLVWRKGTRRSEEFQLLAEEFRRRSRPHARPASLPIAKPAIATATPSGPS